MSTSSAASGSVERFARQVKEADTSANNETLQHIHDDISSIKRSNSAVAQEFWHMQCDTPPAPRICRPDDSQINPLAIKVAMNNMQETESDVGKRIEQLRSTGPVGNTKFWKDFDMLVDQDKSLVTDTDKLYKLTSPGFTDPMYQYDRGAILDEAAIIERLNKQMEKTRKALEKDLRD